MKRVLLTGATGFIGRHCLSSLLANDFEVHAVSSKQPSAQSSDAVTWHQADLLDTEQAGELIKRTQPTHLLHLAWYAVPGKYWTSSENLRWVRASLNLIESFRQHGGERVVAAGTCAEYDWNYGYCSEQLTPLAPATLYGTCKHSLRLILDAYAAQTGLSSAWGRIFFLYGPHEYPSRLVASVVRSLLRDEPSRCSHGKQIRDFLYVQDVADAFVALLASDVAGPVNIGSGNPLALKDVVYRIADMLGRRELVHLGALPAAEGDPALLVAQTSRLNQEVCWSPRFSLDAGLEATIAWWRQQTG